jgi:hypothetical protein
MNLEAENLNEPQNQPLLIADVSGSFKLANQTGRLMFKFDNDEPQECATIYEEELNKMKQLPQTQTSLMKQCEVLRIFANKLGLYDAADFLRNDR